MSCHSAYLRMSPLPWQTPIHSPRLAYLHPIHVTSAEFEPHSIIAGLPTVRLRSGGSAGRCACPERAVLGPAGAGPSRAERPLARWAARRLSEPAGAGCGPLASAGRCGLWRLRRPGLGMNSLPIDWNVCPHAS